MTTDYYYKQKELGFHHDNLERSASPQNWSGLPEGEKIHLSPEPELPQSARKVGDDMIIYGLGGAVLDDNHDVEITDNPIADVKRKVRMRCP